jgi:hypothetical protein
VKPLEARQELVQILREAREIMALPDNDFLWSSWNNATEALAELDQLIAAIESDKLPRKGNLTVLFAPTGPIQEVSISSGWGQSFLDLSTRFDAAVDRVYS